MLNPSHTPPPPPPPWIHPTYLSNLVCFSCLRHVRNFLIGSFRRSLFFTVYIILQSCNHLLKQMPCEFKLTSICTSAMTDSSGFWGSLALTTRVAPAVLRVERDCSNWICPFSSSIVNRLMNWLLSKRCSMNRNVTTFYLFRPLFQNRWTFLSKYFWSTAE